MQFNVAKIAVSSAIYNIDKPYSYLIPDNLKEHLVVGMRVKIPFGRSSKKAEGIVLKICFEENTKNFKSITQILDDKPLLDSNMLKLALFMQKRYFSTFYDVVKTMLPSGLWFDYEDRYIWTKKQIPDDILNEYADIFSKINYQGFVKKNETNEESLNFLTNLDFLAIDSVATQKTKDKYMKIYFLNQNISNHFELANKGVACQSRTLVVEKLSLDKECRQDELIYLTGASKSVLATLVKQNIISFEERAVYRENDIDYTIKKTDISLSEEQSLVYHNIYGNLCKNSFSQNLLLGVTGSGKTMVYIKLIMDCLKMDKSTIVLIPEIALTNQLLTRFTEFFGTNVAILHSKLSVCERYEQWKRIRNGECKVVIGTRSAVFAPVCNLGLIIIDEEHETTFKSETNTRYDAREVAKYRCFQNNCTLLLASATPSVDSYYDALNGKINLHKLEQRYGGVSLPSVFIYDMKLLVKSGEYSSIGTFLRDEIDRNLDKGEQTILFLNRRGNSKQLMCLTCGHVPECINCSTTMTYHSINERVMCHFCGYSYQKPVICSKCSSRHLKTDVSGTQKLELETRELFPEANILRLDTDTARGKNSHNKILDDFKKHKADILIGTQMVTKGLDFENATLVGVIDADQSLYSDDFRANERTFSQITQVVGRAGRRKTRGRAIIQTYNPEHELLIYAKNQQYDKFFEYELSRRKALMFPPINDIFTFVVTGENENKVVNSAINTVEKIKFLKQTMFQNISVLGPTPAKMIKINKKYRYIITIRINDDKQKRKFISGILKEFLSDKQNKGINLYVDLDGEC